MQHIRDGRCCLLFSLRCFFPIRLFVFLFAHRDTSQRCTVCSYGGTALKKQNKNRTPRWPKSILSCRYKNTAFPPIPPPTRDHFFIIPNSLVVSTPATLDINATLKINRKITVKQKKSQSKTQFSVKCILQRVQRRWIKPGVKKRKETENWI